MIPPLQMPGLRISRDADPRGELSGFVHLMQNALVAAAVSLEDFDRAIAAVRMDRAARFRNPFADQPQPGHQLMVRARPAVAANGFVASLERARKVVERIGKEYPGLGEVATAAVASIDVAVPGLKAVRDSAAHIDERNIRRSGRTTIPATGTFWIECLDGDCIVFTAPNGAAAKVRVHQDTLNAVAQAIQKVIDAIAWQPDKRPWP